MDTDIKKEEDIKTEPKGILNRIWILLFVLSRLQLMLQKKIY